MEVSMLPARTSLRLAVLLLSAAASVVRAQAHGAHAAPELGAVDFQVSCDPAVRAEFDRSVALLHHMQYEGARAGFERAAARDPRCGMAHWGVAMTWFHPMWASASADDRRRGAEALAKARALPPRTARERALLGAAEAFYLNPEADEWWPRLERWSAALAESHRAMPDDAEVGAFYALSRLATGPRAGDRRMAQHADAARVLLAIHRRMPTHPGAIHYTIHANDVAARADSSLDVVRSYERVAPTVPHALHMPTHIFVRLGSWPEVIEWNRKSADAALGHPAGDRTSLHHVHALDYLLYAHLQRGEDARARAVLDEALARAGRERYVDDFAVAYHLAAMPARWAVERGDWRAALALAPRTPDYLTWDRYRWAEAITWAARGLGAVRTGDAAAAREAEDRMRALGDSAAAAGDRHYAAYIEIDRRVLAAARALAARDGAAALAHLRAAVELERATEKSPVSPGAILPPGEALGAALLELGRPAEALAAYEASLAIWPKRFAGLLGAARAAREAGDTAKARAHYAALLEVVGDAPDRRGVEEARTFVAAGGGD
jgi:tetratricopeptide (TPR) repeat protein